MSEKRTVGVLLPMCRGYYFRGVLRGIHQVARANGARLIVIQTLPPLLDHDAVPVPGELVSYPQHSIDAWIVVQDAVTSGDARMLLQAGRPLVTIAGSHLGLPCLNVCTDDAAGALAAVRHLLDHGHRHIAFFGLLARRDLRRRHAGYLHAFHERGLEPDPGLLYLADTENDVSNVAAAMHRLLAADSPCTAVFAETDAIALAVLHAARAFGRRVPEDLAVVGFGDAPPARHSTPALTTVRQHPDTLGRTAASLLLAQLVGNSANAGVSSLDAPLILRGSCGCREPAGSGRRAGTPRAVRPAREEPLAQELAAALLAPDPLPPQGQSGSLWPALTAIAAGLEAAATGDVLPPEALLAEAWQVAGGCAADADALDRVLAVLEQAATIARQHNTARKRIAAYLRQARLYCLRAAGAVAERRGEFIDDFIGRSSRLVGRLANLTGERLLDLAWLAHSPVRRGCLARWDEPGEDGRSRRLTVAGSYVRDGVPPVTPGSSWAADAFPPEELLTAPGVGEDDPVLVLPMRTAGNDWGVLALAGPGDGAGSGAIPETFDGLSQLAGYLSAALERNDLLRSLEAERQLLQTLLDAVPDYIYFKDRSSRLVRANKAHAAYVGLQSRAEEIGKTDFDFYPRDVAQVLYDAEQEMMRTRQPLIGVIEDHAAFAQRLCWIQATKVPVVRDGSVVGLVGISRDVTELKRAEEVLARQAAAAEELAELRSGFVATVSHELRSPLTAVVGYAELLEAQWRRLDDPDRLKMVHRIVTSANRQKRLIEELLLLSRLESGPVVAGPEPVVLDRLVRRAVEEIRTSYQGQAIDLAGPADLQVLADPDRALQILLNLIDNAAKYSPEGFPIHVSWSQNSAHADVRVRDFGAGVSERGRERLFTRFGRLPGSRIRAGRVGTGLGLYLARGLARAMLGEVELEATGPGGSTFRLSLPLAAGAQSAANVVQR